MNLSFFSLYGPQIFIAFWLALLPLMLWLIVFWRRSSVPRRLALITFFWGMVAVIPLFVIDYFWDVDGWLKVVVVNSLLSATLVSLWVGFSEEYTKNFIVRWVDFRSKGFNQVIDGITFSIIAALGFSFIENIRFFTLGATQFSFLSWSFVILFIFRTFGSTLTHVFVSGLFGYYFGKAKFANFAHNREKKKRNVARMYIIGGCKMRYKRALHYLRIKRFTHDMRVSIKREEIIGEGLLVAMILHAMFNLALMYKMPYLTIPMLYIEGYIIFKEFKDPENRAVYVIGRAGDEEHLARYTSPVITS